MTGALAHFRWLLLLAVALLAACASGPAPEADAPPLLTGARVDETAMLPLLGYLQLAQQMSAQDLQRERGLLAAMPQYPATQLRLAIVFGQARGAPPLVRALALLDGVLKNADAAAASLHPLARALASQYQERLRLETQNERLLQQWKDSQRKGSELQEKLDALTDIERSLPVRPTAGSNPPGASR